MRPTHGQLGRPSPILALALLPANAGPAAGRPCLRIDAQGEGVTFPADGLSGATRFPLLDLSLGYSGLEVTADYFSVYVTMAGRVVMVSAPWRYVVEVSAFDEETAADNVVRVNFRRV